jgi:hypothetical protein
VAGLSSGTVLVDVIAASERLRSSQWAEEDFAAESVAEKPKPDPELAETASADGTGPQDCPFGHSNPGRTKFCSACGVPMDLDVAARPEPAPPKPVYELSDAERAERDRKHQEALALAARFEAQPETFEAPDEKGVLIHFVEDGLTAFGRVWYRGQELQIGPDNPRWAEAQRWILLTKWQQVERYGKQYFDQGPWPGIRSYEGAAYEQLNTLDRNGKFAGPTEEQVRQAEDAERRRGRGIPSPVFR